MRPARFGIASFAALVLAGAFPVAAQLAPTAPDPLARIRDAAKGSTQACSATGESLCEQVAPKIIANAEGDSPLAENLRRLANEIIGTTSGTTAESRAVAWAVEALHDAGVDVRTEKYATHDGGPSDRENVIAEIRGREKPDEWVLLGAHLDSRVPTGRSLDNNCNAAIVIEAARDIQLTGIRPRRSIRFVLFTGEGQDMLGSWAYVRGHRVDLDRASAAIVFGAGCGRVIGYGLAGRHDIESGVREAVKPIESLGIDRYVFDATLGSDNFDFLLEGVPTLLASRDESGSSVRPPAAANTSDATDIKELKRNAGIAAVTAFGVAERAAPLGPRQSRSEIESLLRTSGMQQQMKGAGIWPLWESGERGRPR